MSAPAVPAGPVRMVRPRGEFEQGDAVVVDVQPYSIPLEGGGLFPSHLYQLRFPGGWLFWYEQHRFEPIEAP